MYGLDSKRTSLHGHGPGHASVFSGLRSRGTWLVHYRVSLYQVQGSSTFMLTLWYKLPPSRSYTYFHYNWMVYLLAKSNSNGWLHAETYAQAFLSGWIARFGVLASITSDHWCHFISELWKDLMHLLGIKPTHTTSYHPQANGMVERMHRQLKTCLKARLTTSSWCT